MCLDTFSYLLGKKSGGGSADIADYFENSGYTDNAGACVKKIPFAIDLTGITNASNYFYKWTNLESVAFKNGNSVTNVYQMFFGCVHLTFIDVRDINFHDITSGGNRNNMLGMSTYKVPTSCLIVVKDDTEKEWFTTVFSSYTNVKTVAEYEAQ